MKEFTKDINQCTKLVLSSLHAGLSDKASRKIGREQKHLIEGWSEWCQRYSNEMSKRYDFDGLDERDEFMKRVDKMRGGVYRAYSGPTRSIQEKVRDNWYQKNPAYAVSFANYTRASQYEKVQEISAAQIDAAVQYTKDRFEKAFMFEDQKEGDDSMDFESAPLDDKTVKMLGLVSRRFIKTVLDPGVYALAGHLKSIANTFPNKVIGTLY